MDNFRWCFHRLAHIFFLHLSVIVSVNKTIRLRQAICQFNFYTVLTSIFFINVMLIKIQSKIMVSFYPWPTNAPTLFSKLIIVSKGNYFKLSVATPHLVTMLIYCVHATLGHISQFHLTLTIRPVYTLFNKFLARVAWHSNKIMTRNN